MKWGGILKCPGVIDILFLILRRICGQFMGDDPACIYLKSQISLNASNRIYFQQTDRILTFFYNNACPTLRNQSIFSYCS